MSPADGGKPDVLDESMPVWAMEDQAFSDSPAADDAHPAQINEPTASADATENIRADELQPAIVESETSDKADTAPTEEESDPEWANGDAHLELPSENDLVERAPRVITVVLEAGQDNAKDGRKLARIHNTLLKYPGKDRFQDCHSTRGQEHTAHFSRSDHAYLRRTVRRPDRNRRWRSIPKRR